MTFNANVAPKDASGRPIEPGRYTVQRGGQVRTGTVYESPDDLALLVSFEGEERQQRVDELSQFCTWTRIEEAAA